MGGLYIGTLLRKPVAKFEKNLRFAKKIHETLESVSKIKIE